MTLNDEIQPIWVLGVGFTFCSFTQFGRKKMIQFGNHQRDKIEDVSIHISSAKWLILPTEEVIFRTPKSSSEPPNQKGLHPGNSSWILNMMFSKGSFNSNRSIFGIYGNLQGCTPPETALREEPAWQEKPWPCETSQTGPEHCQLCSVAPLQAVESTWVRPEMDLPKPSTM